MRNIIERTQKAGKTFDDIIDRVCGSCDNSCCYQGTMMGAHDALRLVKGMATEPGREQTLRDGLRQRADELASNVAAIEKVHELINIGADAATDPAQTGELNRAIAQWRDFVEFLKSPWPPTEDSIRRMLQFSGIRAIALRSIGKSEGAHAALANLSIENSTFRLRGSQIAPPRCLFHSMTAGCLAGRWKPGKCANFFCTGDPNVLEALREALDFDDFVLANAEAAEEDRILDVIRREFAFGARYVEPKVIIGLSDEGADTIRDELDQLYAHVDTPAPHAPRFMLSVTEWRNMLDAVGQDEAVLIKCDAIHGSTLYEFGVALDEYRARGAPVPVFLLAREFLESPDTPHPLWTGAQMGQPLGVLDIFITSSPAPP